MKRKAFYKQEQNNGIFLVALGIFVTGILIYLRIVDPAGWDPNGFILAMGFMVVWNVGVIVIGRGLNKSKKEFINKRDVILENGLVYNGQVIDYRIEKSTRMGSNHSTIINRHYYALVKFNDGKENAYWTPELNFDPRMLESTQVSVHIYNNDFYVDDYVIGNKINKSLVKEAGKKNIWVYIHIIAFSILWFGLLILVDYIAIRDKQWQLIAFSLIFWIAGIYNVNKNLRKYK